MGKKLELALGILNGTIGDYLAQTGNGLATPMRTPWTFAFLTTMSLEA